MKICTFENIASCHHFCCIFSQAVQSLRAYFSIVCRNASTFLLCRKELSFPQCLEFGLAEPPHAKPWGEVGDPVGTFSVSRVYVELKIGTVGSFTLPARGHFQGLGISFVRVRRTGKESCSCENKTSASYKVVGGGFPHSLSRLGIGRVLKGTGI